MAGAVPVPLWMRLAFALVLSVAVGVETLGRDLVPENEALRQFRQAAVDAFWADLSNIN